MKYIFTLLLLAHYFTASAQIPPEYKSEKIIGAGSQEQDLKICAVPNNSKRFYIGSLTYWSPGIHGGADMSVGAIDDTGKVIWQMCIGGSNAEDFGNIYTTNDGGVIVVGSGASTDGDIVGNHGSYDGFIFRYDENGTLIWKKSLGGSAGDFLYDIVQTNDGGFIATGSTASHDGDLLGINPGTSYKKQTWIVKMDANGNIQWQKAYGGTDDDTGYIIRQNASGGYVVGSETFSNDGNVYGKHGTNLFIDIWLIEIGASGYIYNSNCFGGSGNDFIRDIKVLNNNGYLLVGTTYCNDGDVIGLHGTNNTCDMWVVGVSPFFSVSWQKCLGGTANDYGGYIIDLPNGSHLINGTAASNDGDVTGNKGNSDAWLVNIENSGVVNWTKCIGTSKDEHGFDIVIKNDLEYYLADLHQVGTTITDRYLLITAGAVNTITGKLFIDNNNNGVKDPAEKYMNSAVVNTLDSFGKSYSSYPLNGVYKTFTDTGKFTTSVTPFLNYYTVAPVSDTVSFTTFYNTDTADFAFIPLPNKHDLAVYLIPLTRERIGDTSKYKIIYKNLGTDTVSGVVKLVKSYLLSLVSSSVPYSSFIADTLVWNFNDLEPEDTASILLSFYDPNAQFNDPVFQVATINSPTADLDSSNNHSMVFQIFRGSYDPNDKSEIHGGSIVKQAIQDGDWLNYTIRFQNTGNDTAYKVLVRDTLSSKLDWSTFQIIDASHQVQTQVTDGSTVAFTFDNINLVDSNHNEPASHGYVTFIIRPKASLLVGDTIFNQASIYFDFNAAVKTNREQTIVVSNLLPVKLVEFTAVKKENLNLLNWTITNHEDLKTFNIERSDNGSIFSTIGVLKAAGRKYAFADEHPLPTSNYYRLKMTDNDGRFTYSPIREITSNIEHPTISIYPNPGKDNITISGSNISSISLTDNTGRILLTQNGLRSNNTTLNISKFAKGVYLLKVQDASKRVEVKKVVKGN